MYKLSQEGLGIPESPWPCHPGLASSAVLVTPFPGQHWSEWLAARDPPSGMARVGLTPEPQIQPPLPERPQHAALLL